MIHTTETFRESDRVGLELGDSDQVFVSHPIQKKDASSSSFQTVMQMKLGWARLHGHNFFVLSTPPGRTQSAPRTRGIRWGGGNFLREQKKKQERKNRH